MSNARRSRGREQQVALLAGAVDHVLEHGVAEMSLRPLAAALGTSDRMLLYYFGSREQLLTEILAAVGDQLRAALDDGLPDRPIPPAALVSLLTVAVADPEADRHLKLYLEISGLAARRREPFLTIAADVARHWMDWTAARLDVPDSQRGAAAAAVLTIIDGLLLVRTVTSDRVASASARWLIDHLQ